MVDGQQNNEKSLLILSINFILSTKSSYAIEFQGKFIQGHFIIGKTESDTKVLIDKKEVRVF